MPASQREIKKDRFPLIQLLDSEGDGTGVTDFALNFSEETTYQALVPAGVTNCLTEITMHFIGNGGISPDGFGGGVELINGIKLFYVQSGVEVFVDQLEFIKSNYELSLITTIEFITVYQGNDKGYRGELNIKALGIECIKLNGDNGDCFKAVFNDDFTTRISIGQVVLDGYQESNS